MATAAIKQPEPLENRVQVTVLALREEIMRYFKGSCIERLTDHNIQRVPLAHYMERLPYQYQRIDLEMSNPQLLLISDVPIAVMCQQPETITLLTKTLKLTPGLRRTESELRRFLKKFLAGIPLKENATLKLDKDIAMTLPSAADDERIFRSQVKEPMETPEIVYQMAYQYDSGLVNQVREWPVDDMPF